MGSSYARLEDADPLTMWGAVLILVGVLVFILTYGRYLASDLSTLNYIIGSASISSGACAILWSITHPDE